MPVPRGEDTARNGDLGRFTAAVHQGAAIPQARPLTSAEMKRRERAKISNSTRNAVYVWVEPRNGLPFRPYVYRGTGADAFTGEIVL